MNTFGRMTIVALAFAGLSACSSSDKNDGTVSAQTGTDAGTPEPGGGDFKGPPPTIPDALEECPTLATGTMNILGVPVQLFVGERREDRKGTVLFYWHGTGSVSQEISAFMSAQIDEVVADGGVVASFTTSKGTGTYTGPFVWYSDDLTMADQILACAVKQLNIDTRRIYSAGCSAGGLQTSAMVYRRSSYLAAAMPNSGGAGEAGELEDPDHVPAVMTTHGLEGKDVVAIDFSKTSALFDADIVSKGGFAIDCNHGGGHCGAPAEVVAAQWQFLKDHPYGYATEPYADGLPASFPSYCKIITQ